MKSMQIYPRLYDNQPFCMEFEAEIIDRRPEKEGYAVQLSVDGFFPTGGGQTCDKGFIGRYSVKDVKEENGEIWHCIEDRIEAGTKVICKIDASDRIMKMQNHTGEHILSGLIFRKYGFQNVGFHLGSNDTTADFDGFLSENMITEILTEANRVVREDLPVTVSYPTKKELKSLAYRSKLNDIDGVRLVAIGDIDLCACCAPHVLHTGQIGAILITECKAYKGGCRIHILCGERATNYLNEERNRTDEACRYLSATHENLPGAVGRILEENRMLKQKITDLNEKSNCLIVSVLLDKDEVIYYEDDRNDPEAARRLSLALAEKNHGTAGVFLKEGGRFYIASKNMPLRKNFNDFSKETGAKGGGSDELICGTAGKGNYKEIFYRCFMDE